jgi:hypothetical protein
VSRGPMDFERELRDASDETLRALARLEELENQKRTLAPGTERFVSLAREIEASARSILTSTQRQERLADESVERAIGSEPSEAPIDLIDAPRDVPTILADWRDAERRLSRSTPGTDDEQLAARDVRRLRMEYRRALDVAQGR